MLILFCGSRSFVDGRRIDITLNHLMNACGEFTVLNGGARGADTLAHFAGLKLGLKSICVKPDWNKYGKRAGFLRNAQMLEMGPELVVAFWDGESRGTAHTIDLAINRYRIPVLIVQ